jgi:hypothetical protein
MNPTGTPRHQVFVQRAPPATSVDAQIVELDGSPGEGVGVAREPSHRAVDEHLEQHVVGARDNVDVAEFLDLEHPAHVTREFLDRNNFRDLGQPCDELRSDVHLGVERVVVGHDRQPHLGDLAEMLDDSVVGGTVQGGRQQQDTVGAVVFGVFGPHLRLMPADAVHAGDHQAAAVDRVDGHLDHLAASGIGQRRVLAQRAVRPDPPATVAHQEVDVFAKPVIVHRETGRRRPA